MTTNNLISTPEITGNIGSCETKSVEAPVNRGIIKNTYQVVMTNSCTGQVIKDYQYTEWSGFMGFVFAVFLFCVCVGATAK